MSVFRGSGSGTITSTAYNIPATINSFSIVNTSGGNITVTVYINSIAVTGIAYSLKSGQAYVRDSAIRMQSNDVITINASGTIDYYFTIE
jgi:hypothetical protein